MSSTEGRDWTRYVWLSAIKDHLSPPTQEIFSELRERLGELPDDAPTFEGVHTWQPIPPTDAETIEAWTVEQVVRYATHFTGPEEALDGPSKEGLQGLIEFEVVRRPDEFAAAAGLFFSAEPGEKGMARPALALLRGLERSVEAAKTPDARKWVLEAALDIPVLRLIGAAAKQPKEDTPRYSRVPTWETVTRAGADLLLRALEMAVAMPPAAVNSLLDGRELEICGLLETLQEAPDAVASSETDPTHLAINSTRGRGIFAVLAFIRCLHARRQKEVNTAGGDNVDAHEARMLSFLEERLAVEDRPAVRCVFGWRLPYLHAVSHEWLTKNVNQILPTAPSEETIWFASWDAYLGFNNLYKDLWEELRPHYLLATYRIGHRPYSLHHEAEIDARLGVHIFLAWFEQLAEAEPTLSSFLSHASDEMKSRMVRFGAEVLRENVVGKEAAAQSTDWATLKRFWSERVLQAAPLGLADCGPLEKCAFAQWLEHSPEDLPSLAPLIEAILPGFDSARDWEATQLIHYLAGQAQKHPTESTELLLALAQRAWPRWFTSDEKETLIDAMKVALAIPESAQSVRALVGLLGQRYELFDYREVLKTT